LFSEAGPDMGYGTFALELKAGSGSVLKSNCRALEAQNEVLKGKKMGTNNGGVEAQMEQVVADSHHFDED
jgi:hypothetical protein